MYVFLKHDSFETRLPKNITSKNMISITIVLLVTKASILKSKIIKQFRKQILINCTKIVENKKMNKNVYFYEFY